MMTTIGGLIWGLGSLAVLVGRWMFAGDTPNMTETTLAVTNVLAAGQLIFKANDKTKAP